MDNYVTKCKRTWERRIVRAKKKHRPRLSDWSRDGFCSSRAKDFFSLRDISYASRDYDDQIGIKVDRISYASLSSREFLSRYEIPQIPCVILDVPNFDKWKAISNWNFSCIREKFKNRYFKVGEDDKGIF